MLGFVFEAIVAGNRVKQPDPLGSLNVFPYRFNGDPSQYFQGSLRANQVNQHGHNCKLLTMNPKPITGARGWASDWLLFEV